MIFTTAQLRTLAMELRATTWAMVPSPTGLGITLGPGHDPQYGNLYAWMRGWAAEWGRAGMPSLRMGHRQAAALMATSTPASDIRPPWRVFEVQVPQPLITLIDRDSGESPVSHMLVASFGDRWSYVAIADRCEYTRSHMTLAELAGDDLSLSHLWLDNLLPLQDHDERAVRLLDRLLLNACVLLSDAEHMPVRELGKRPPGAARRPAAVSGADGPRVLASGAYEFTHDVTVDCREPVRQYLTGSRGTAPSVRVLVRGHWRAQPYGAGRQLTRRQWIEPFWRGPLYAPMAVREHRLPDVEPDTEATPKLAT